MGVRDSTVVEPGTPPEDVPRSHRKVESKRLDEKPPENPFLNLPPNPAGLLVGLAEGMFAAAWGNEARFTSKEREMIEPPLGRILERMSPDDATKFAAFADPVFLAAGLLIYGVRVWTIQQRNAPTRTTPTPIRQDEPVVQGIPESHVRQQNPAHVDPNGKVSDDIARSWGAL